MAKSPWRPVFAGAVFVCLAIAFIITPGSFATPDRSRGDVLIVGWITLCVFGTFTGILLVRALRSGARRQR
jgi:hypothetical protein